jgi:hypothetical protein
VGDDREATAAALPVPGPEAIAGALVFTTALRRADIDQQTQQRLLKALADTLPLQPLRPGIAGNDRTVTPDTLKVLLPSAAVVAAGLDPATIVRPPPPVLWTDGANQLVVRVGEVRADLTLGAIVLTIPVTCDQTGPVDCTVTFVTGTPDRPAGGITTTEDHPRGPAEVVENWAEPLIAFAWHTLLIAINSISSALGGDLSGQKLLTAALSVTADGVTVTPMGRHTFMTGALAASQSPTGGPTG